MRIGLDIDGVIYQWDKTARYMLREVLPDSPYRIAKDDARTYQWEMPLYSESKSWNYIQEHVKPEHWDWLWTEGVRLGLFRYGHLFPGAVQAVRELAGIGEVTLVTHRPKAALKDTLAWLALMDFPISGLVLLTNEEPKSTVKPGFDFFVDDKPANVMDVNKGTRARAYLMRRPWNASFVSSWPLTVASLADFAGVIRREVAYGRA